ncbi:AAA family ATPase [Candidatus Acetothermia bacterium]|nr:AAA family ATPase [Candidatus Acetothermia bacterium]
MGLRIRMFGEFAVWRDNALIEDWGSEQTKALLKILLGERGRIFRCEQLAEYLWPEHSDYTQALRFLRAYVHQLRRVLEPGKRAPSLYIQTLRDSYRFSAEAECTIDVEEFVAHSQRAKELIGQKKYGEAAPEYEQAISLYAGDYLSEDRYEEWAIAERDRWCHQYVSALLGLAECEARQGHYRHAVELCRQAWTADKYREDIYRQAMLYNYFMGNQGEALRLYQECERVLSRELGVKPSEPTRHLYEQIREGHIVELDRAYPTPELVPYPVHHSLSRLPFVGRREEYSRLLRRLEEASEGSGGLVLIGGEVGAGKTRLAQEIIRYAQTRFKTRALQGRCTELGAKQPYQALLHALRDYLLALDQQAREQLPALSLDVLAPWLPDLGLPRRSALSLPPLRPDQERLRFFAAIRQLLIQVSETHPPLLLFLDDLQWTDPSTVDFLDYLLSQIAEHPLLILGTYRSEELQKDHPLMPLTRRVLRERVGQGTDDLQLSQLSEQEIDELLRGVSPALKDRERLSRYLHRESGGNPLFLVAILQSLFEARVITTTAAGDWTEPIWSKPIRASTTFG